MKYLIILSMLCFAACGKHVTVSGTPAPAPSACPATPTEPSILSKWVETAAPAVISQPDFSSLSLNTTGDADATLGCTGSYGNNIVVNTLTSGQIRVQGTATEGIVQFGNVKYFGMDYTTTAGLNCKNASKEMYAYTIRNQQLTLCLTNLSYPYCSTYTLGE